MSDTKLERKFSAMLLVEAEKLPEQWRVVVKQAAQTIENLCDKLDVPPPSAWIACAGCRTQEYCRSLGCANGKDDVHRACTSEPPDTERSRLREAVIAAYPLLRRIRDRVDQVQFFEANAVMGLMEEALKAESHREGGA